MIYSVRNITNLNITVHLFVQRTESTCVLYGEVNSIKNTTTDVWLNDGVYYQWKNHMFRPIAAVFRF